MNASTPQRHHRLRLRPRGIARRLAHMRNLILLLGGGWRCGQGVSADAHAVLHAPTSVVFCWQLSNPATRCRAVEAMGGGAIILSKSMARAHRRLPSASCGILLERPNVATNLLSTGGEGSGGGHSVRQRCARVASQHHHAMALSDIAVHLSGGEGPPGGGHCSR